MNFAKKCCVGLFLMMPSVAAAEDIFVPNFSFEEPVRGDDQYTQEAPVGWTAGNSNNPDGVGVQNAIDSQYPGTTFTGTPGEDDLDAPAHGKQFAYINAGGTNVNHLTSLNPLGNGVKAFTLYTLTVAVGDRGDGVEPRDVKIELLVEPAVEGGLTTSAAAAMLTGEEIDVVGLNQDDQGAFVNLTASFQTDGTSPLIGRDLKIRLTHFSNGRAGEYPQVSFDNVRLVATAVPEPSSAALALLGASALLRRRRAV